MKSKQIYLFILCFSVFSQTLYSNNAQSVLWYEKPAKSWNEALPVGNGFMGAMAFGGITRERLQLNESTLYSGEPSSRIESVDIRPQYEEVVHLLREGEYSRAQKMMIKHWQGRLPQSYVPMVDLFMTFEQDSNKVTDYRRSLDLENAVTTTTYKSDGITYTRELFASNPDKVLVFRFRADQEIPLSFTLEFTSGHPTTTINFPSGSEYSIIGQAPGYCDRRPKEQLISSGLTSLHPEYFDEKGTLVYDKPLLYGGEINGEGMFFESRIRILKGEAEVKPGKLKVKGKGEITLLITAATSYNGMWKSPSREGIDYRKKNEEVLNAASTHSFDRLNQRHQKDYHELYDRAKLSLGSRQDYTSLPTDKRILSFHQHQDNDLAALLFQYGRYLLISSSRPGGQPANLQGLWNDVMVPRWNCGYTMNINLQMNYWQAELTGLSECALPLFDLIRELSQSGKTVAEKMYQLPGWTAHHNTSLWREAFPTDGDPSWTFWNLTPGWLCRHLWEHYLFTEDIDFLRNKAYPLMKGAAEFYAAWLIQNKDGYWITPIGVSPENIFVTPNGEQAAVSMGPTMDIAIIREFFTFTLQAAEILDVDPAFCQELRQKRDKLLPYQIGRKGQIQEWMYDFDETEPQHRHLSHLYGLYPGNQLTFSSVPELMEAARRTLTLRGDEATGWSMGWKINFWARMRDGNHAYKIIRNLFTPVEFGGKEHTGGGLYLNMLDAHPPFQIDGNFGFTAGLVEMLLQSHENELRILPALPDNWNKGSVEGLRARGGFVVDIAWEDGLATMIKIKSLLGNPCRLSWNGNIKEFSTVAGKQYEFK